MIYTVERAELVSAQLQKLTSGYAHHVAAHFANLDYWLDEAAGAIASIDSHNDRFDALKSAQSDWVDRHKTQVPTHGYCGMCGGKCEFSDDSTSRPRPPRNAATSAKTEARRELVDSVYYFLARFCRMGLLTEQEMTRQCDKFGTSIDPADLRAP